MAVDIGDQLEGRFTIRAELAYRDARWIYFASDAVTGGRCEVHVLAASANDIARKEFSREAELLGRIDHPGCLSTAGVGGLPDGTLYYVVAERSANRITDRVGMELPAYHVADVAGQLLRALQHIHELDWRLGWLTPDHVDERLIEGRFVARIVRMPAARLAGTVGPTPDGAAADYAHPGLVDGALASVHSDMHAAGRVILQLATGSLALPLPQATAPQCELAALVDRLIDADGGEGFASAGEAADGFERFCASAVGVPPAVPPPPRSARQSRFRTSDISAVHAVIAQEIVHDDDVGMRDGLRPSAPSLPLQPRPPAGVIMEAAPKRGRKGVVAVAALALAGVVVAVVALRSNDPAPPPASDAAVVAAPAPGAVDAEPLTEPAAAIAGNPTRVVAALNRTNLAQVLPFAERHALLDEIAARPALLDRVDARWNRLLDLAQAADAPTPCTTFAAALPELRNPAQTPAERALVATIRVPTPSTMLGAGIAPDGDCTGLVEAFAEVTPQAAVADHPSPAGRTESRKHAPKAKARPAAKVASVLPPSPSDAPVAPSTASPVASPPASRPAKAETEGRAVASRLDDDIKGLN